MSEEWQQARQIEASEIGDYLYCRRQWWLWRVHGVSHTEMERMEAGIRAHARHNALLQRAERNENLFYLLVMITVAVLVFWLLVHFAG
jgi:CRISPR/Cas system-associated exonuclease Cas4 (RecB family)